MTKSHLELEFCEQFQIEEYKTIAEDFLLNVLELSLEECFLSDESELADFSLMSSTLDTGGRSWDEAALAKIRERYGVEMTTTHVNLVTLFAMIDRSRNKTLQ